MDKEKLIKRIRTSDIPPGDAEALIRRLKVASHEGVAAVVRDFDHAMALRRARVLPSHRHLLPSLLRQTSPSNKLASFYHLK
jgi:hypothetical protein